MKFQNRSIHGSKVNRRTDRQTDKPKAICPSNFFKVGGINMKALVQILFEISCTHDFQILISKGHNSKKGHNSDMKKYGSTIIS